MGNQRSRKKERHMKLVAAHEDATEKRRALAKARRTLRRWAEKQEVPHLIQQQAIDYARRQARQQERITHQAAYDARVLEATKGTS